MTTVRLKLKKAHVEEQKKLDISEKQVVGGRMIQPRIYKPQSRKFKVAGKKHLK
jgi:hypothetical protein